MNNALRKKAITKVMGLQVGFTNDFVVMDKGQWRSLTAAENLAVDTEYAVLVLEETKETANKTRDEAMLLGVDYQGSMISLTDVDGNGMLQVKAAFEMGLPSTTIHFKNGTKLPMTAASFSAFALWFVTERNRFFV